MTVENREIMIEWCCLLTGYNEKYFLKMSDTDLTYEYQKLMGAASEKMEDLK